MKTLFDPARMNEVKRRMASLRPESERQWGKMTVAQMVAHCSASLELALGERLPPRLFVGRIIGGIIKPLVFKDDAPMRRNSPTLPGLVMVEERELMVERERFYTNIDRFCTGGRDGCTRHPHSFFGRLTPEEWAILMYKHLDHHLRQFNA